MLVRIKLHVCGTTLLPPDGWLCLALRVCFPLVPWFCITPAFFSLLHSRSSLSISHTEPDFQLFTLVPTTQLLSFLLSLSAGWIRLYHSLVIMFGKTSLTSLSVSALFATGAFAALDPIVIKVSSPRHPSYFKTNMRKGSKFFFKSNGTQFFIKGVAYQSGISSGGATSTDVCCFQFSLSVDLYTNPSRPPTPTLSQTQQPAKETSPTSSNSAPTQFAHTQSTPPKITQPA